MSWLRTRVWSRMSATRTCLVSNSKSSCQQPTSNISAALKLASIIHSSPYICHKSGAKLSKHPKMILVWNWDNNLSSEHRRTKLWLCRFSKKSYWKTVKNYVITLLYNNLAVVTLNSYEDRRTTLPYSYIKLIVTNNKHCWINFGYFILYNLLFT